MNITILAAHADDETLGAGGLIPKMVTAGHDISIVLASDGHIKARAEGIYNLLHFEQACAFLGVKDLKYLGFKDQYFDKYPIADIANKALKAINDPDIIISHVATDLNKDHQIMCEVAKIVGRPKKKPISLLGMEIANTSAWNGQAFPANFYVDITETIAQKIKAFSFYQNEVTHFPYPYSLKGIEVLAQYRGMEAGCLYAEAYQVIRMYPQHSLFFAI